MRSPDVASAVTRLQREGILAPEQAHLFGRVARGELVSLSAAIHALLYLGVVALTTGAGLLFRDEIEHLGPMSLAGLVGTAGAACLAWAARRSPPFSRTEVSGLPVAFDYVLVLGALLLAGDLAFIEARFSPLGDDWAYHLLLVSLGYGALAFRFDSRTLFGLALTTFAAWRGVAATSVERALFRFFEDTNAVRLNTFLCGLAFVLLGRMLKSRGFKAHFEPTAAHLGWLLVLQAIAWGMVGGPREATYRLALVLVGGGLAWWSWRGKRFALFVFGVLAAYLGTMIALADAANEEKLVLLLVSASTIALLFGLAAVHRRFPREAEE